MPLETALPSELSTVIGGERIDFSVKAKRDKPLKSALSLFFGGMLFFAIPVLLALTTIPALLSGEEIRMEVNGVPTVASLEQLTPLIWPGVILGIFLVIGIMMVISGAFALKKEGGYFVGTPTRLIHFRKGAAHSINWEQFSGDIKVQGGESLGTIALQMRTGRMVSKKNNQDRYVPDYVYLVGIPSVFDVENACRKRIQEHDPTPPHAQGLGA